MCEVSLVPLEGKVNGRLVMTLGAFWPPSNGDLHQALIVQELKPCGMPYSIKERPKGFKQYETIVSTEFEECAAE